MIEDFLNIAQDKSSAVQVNVLYKGEKLTKEFFDKNPEVQKLYPTIAEFQKIYLELLGFTFKGYKSVLEITEIGVKKYPNVLPN